MSKSQITNFDLVAYLTKQYKIFFADAIFVYKAAQYKTIFLQDYKEIRISFSNFCLDKALEFISKFCVFRLIWFIVVLAGMGYWYYVFSETLRTYLQYPTITRISTVYEKQSEFPAVTLCNYNSIS